MGDTRQTLMAAWRESIPSIFTQSPLVVMLRPSPPYIFILSLPAW